MFSLSRLTALNSDRKPIKWAGIVFLISIFAKLLILGFLLNYGGQDALLLGDSKRYLSLAQSLIEHGSFLRGENLESFRPPGYPFYLLPFAYFHIPLIVASLVQIIIASLIPLMAIYIAMRFLQLPQKPAIIVGIISAIEPILNYYAVILLPDVFFTVLILFAVIYFTKWLEIKKLIYIEIAGIAIGLANYLRPAGLYLTIALIILGLLVLLFERTFTRQRVLHLFLLFILPLFVTFPWYLRNEMQFNHFAFTSMAPQNLYTYVGPAVEGAATNRTYAQVWVEWRDRARLEVPNKLYLQSFDNTDYYVSHVWNTIKAHPYNYISVYLLGLNTFWFGGNYHYLLATYKIIPFPLGVGSFSMIMARGGVSALIHEIVRIGTTPYVLIAILGKIFWFSIVGASVIGLWLYRRKPFAWVMLTLMAYFSATILSTTIGVEPRHRYAMNPLLFVFFVATLYQFYGYITHTWQGRKVARSLRRNSRS